MPATRPRHLPDDGDNNGWYRTLPPPAPARRVDRDRRVQWAVLGAGCCGLAVARQLAERQPGAEIVLLEAERIGYGASGRNSGFMLDVHATGYARDFALIQRQAELWRAGVQWLRELVAEHQIRCDWSEWGRLYAAAGEEGEGHLRDLERLYDDVGVGYEALDAPALAALTGSEFYARAIHVGGSALVQPAALMRGLGATLPANVMVFEESPVHEVRRDGGWALHCAGGVVRADKVVFAAGVFMGELGVLRHRIVPLALYASLTRPLTAAERAVFGSTEELGILPSSPNGSTVRLTLDGRILMRNWTEYAPGKRFTDRSLAHARSEHRAAIDRRWPSLAGVEIAHTWGGLMGVTRNEGALFAEVGDGAWAVGTSDVSPVVRGTIAGKLLGDHLSGEDGRLLALQRGLRPANRLPPDPLLGLVVNHRLRRMRAAGAAEV